VFYIIGKFQVLNELHKLEFKDWTAIAALIVSVISIYLSSLRRAMLWVVAGDYIILGYTSGGHTAIGSALTFGNKGARAGAVVSCGGTIRALPNGQAMNIRWHHRYETKNVGTPGESVRMHNANVGWPEPILVPGKDISTERLVSFTVQPYELNADTTYEVVWEGHCGPGTNKRIEVKRLFFLTEKDSRFLRRPSLTKKAYRRAV
jgi:hypothetical protein